MENFFSGKKLFFRQFKIFKNVFSFLKLLFISLFLFFCLLYITIFLKILFSFFFNSSFRSVNLLSRIFGFFFLFLVFLNALFCSLSYISCFISSIPASYTPNIFLERSLYNWNYTFISILS